MWKVSVTEILTLRSFMSLSYDELDLDFSRCLSEAANVPDDPYARLMYYLKTVQSIVDLGIPDRLTDYRNYDDLSRRELELVLYLARKVVPDTFIKKGLFVLAPGFCNDGCTNGFWEGKTTRAITAIQSRRSKHAMRVEDMQVMTYKKEWLRRNYYGPLEDIANSSQVCAVQ